MHTVSLEIAKRLFDAGLNKSEFRWYNTLIGWRVLGRYDVPKSFHKKVSYPAYTLGELIRELPDGYAISRRNNKYYVHDFSAFIQEDKEGNMIHLSGWANLICGEIELAPDAVALAWIALKNQTRE